MLNIALRGIFRVTGPGLTDLTPRGNKARAVIAMLALSPDRRRTRAWIQDKLWSDRAPEQAAGSLRQVLSEIRLALGDERGRLGSDTRCVWLAGEGVAFDLDVERLAPLGGSVAPGDDDDLLDGIIVRDPEFQDWHRAVLQAWDRHRRRPDSGPDSGSDAGPREAASAAASPPVRPGGAGGGPPPPWPGPLLFLARGVSRSDRATAEWLASCAAQAVRETGFEVRIGAPGRDLDAGADGDGRFRMSILVGSGYGQTGITIRVERPDDGLAWTGTASLPTREFGAAYPPAVLRVVHEAADALLDCIIAAPEAGSTGPSAPVLAAIGARRLFSLGPANFAAAGDLFRSALDREPRGVFYAWTACLKAMMLGETPDADARALGAEAEELARRALELDPQNATALALCAHVSNFVTRDFFTGFELSRRAVERAPASPLALTMHATSNVYLGRHAEADRLAEMSCNLCSNSNFRYFADTSRTISAALAGDYETALRMALVTHGLKRDYLPPLRYLAALHLHRGEHEAANGALEDLRRRIPGYSLEVMRESSARIPGYAGSRFFDFTARDIE